MNEKKGADEVVLRFGAKRVVQMLQDLEAGGFVSLTEGGVALRALAEKTAKEPFGAHLGEEAQVVAGRLRDWRREVARRRNVSAYVVMTNRVLFALAAARPTTKEELRACGVAEKTVAQEGDLLLFCFRER